MHEVNALFLHSVIVTTSILLSTDTGYSHGLEEGCVRNLRISKLISTIYGLSHLCLVELQRGKGEIWQ